MIILGLDVSTNCTGYTLLRKIKTNDFELLKIGHIDTSKGENIWDKLDIFKREMSEVLKDVTVNIFYVEEALLAFSAGASNANTITKLVMFNALVSNFIRDRLSQNPNYVKACSARKICGIKTASKKSSGKSVKEQTFEQVTTRILKDFQIELTRTGKPKPHNFDEIDSFVVALAGLKLTKD